MIDEPLSLSAIVDAIEELTPEQRRQLQRRLYAGGLFVPDVLLTDQNRLAAAPALGDNFLQQRARRTVALRAQRAPANKSAPATKSESSSFVSHLMPRTSPSIDPNAPYRSPVSGTVVLGTPDLKSQESDPHLMPPLPGQAPERPIRMIIASGSYILHWPGEEPHRVRLNFKQQVGEHEAYYDTLIHLLEVIERRLQESKADPQSARLDIRSDNEDFLRQARGPAPIQEPLLQIRYKALHIHLGRFGDWRFSR